MFYICFAQCVELGKSLSAANLGSVSASLIATVHTKVKIIVIIG